MLLHPAKHTSGDRQIITCFVRGSPVAVKALWRIVDNTCEGHWNQDKICVYRKAI